MRRPVRIGVGGPVGSGKTALLDCLCKSMRDRYQLAVVTNDIFTREDMEFLVRSEALPPNRVIGVETGGCPHTAIREDGRLTSRPWPKCNNDSPTSTFCFLKAVGIIWLRVSVPNWLTPRFTSSTLRAGIKCHAKVVRESRVPTCW